MNANFWKYAGDADVNVEVRMEDMEATLVIRDYSDDEGDYMTTMVVRPPTARFMHDALLTLVRENLAGYRQRLVYDVLHAVLAIWDVTE